MVKKKNSYKAVECLFWTHPTRDATCSKLQLSKKKIGDKKLLVEHTPFFKWLDVFRMDDIKSTTLIACFCTSFCIYVLSHVVVSDDGPCFINSDFKMETLKEAFYNRPLSSFF